VQLREYWTVVVRRWWLFVLIAGVAAASAFLYSRLQRPIYKSSVLLTVEGSRPDYGLQLTGEAALRLYARRLLSEDFAREVNRRLNLDLTAETLKGMTRASAIPEDSLVQMDVYDVDPGRAQRIAKAWGEVFVEDQEERNERLPDTVPDRILINLLEQPKPGELDSPKTRVNVTAAAVLGLVIAAIIAFLLEYLDDTLKSPEDLERYLGLVMLGGVPRISAAELRQGGINAALKGPDLRPKVTRRAEEESLR
jgi:capsular polysaccharide biosynthesis protein